MTFTWLTGAVIAALVVAATNLIVTYIIVRRNDKRAAEDRALAEKTRDLVDVRERETDRHKRFATIVEQLAADKNPIRLGALYALSALADEWSQEAKRILDAPKSPLQLHREVENKRYLISKIEKAKELSAHATAAYEKAVNQNSTVDLCHSRTVKIDAQNNLNTELRAYRSLRMFIQANVSDAAKNAIGQRDACISLLCAYLRDRPYSSDITSRKVRQARKANKADNKLPRQATGRRNRPDHEARSTAIAIMRKHLSEDAQYPWPGNAIDLTGAHLEYANLQGVHLEGAHLDGANLHHAKLDGSHLSEALISRAKLDYAWLNGADLQKSNLTRTSLNHVKARGSSFLGANLVQAQLENAILHDANFRNAHLWKARLKGAHIWHALFHKATLYDADLTEAELVGADLRNAYFMGAKLEKANLQAAEMGDPQSKNEVSIATSNEWVTHSTEITWDQETKWPDGFDVVETINRQKRR